MGGRGRRSRWSCCWRPALFWRSFSETRDTDPGFKREGVLLAALRFHGPESERAGGARLRARDCSNGCARCPDVEAAAIACRRAARHSRPAAALVHARRPRVERRRRRTGRSPTPSRPATCRTMGIPLRGRVRFRRPAGRRGAAAGDRQRGVRAPVSSTAREPLGRRLESRGTTYAIAGVVRNSISEAFGEPPTPVIYLSYRDRPAARGEIHSARVPAPNRCWRRRCERVVRELDPVPAGLRRPDADRARREEPVPPPHPRADVRRPRSAAARARRDRHLRGGGVRRRPADDRDRRAARARRHGRARGVADRRREPARHRRGCAGRRG